MGKHRVNILLIVTLLFAAFLAGFYTGRNYNHSPIQVSNLSGSIEATVSTAPAALSVPFVTTQPLATEPLPQAYAESTETGPTVPVTEPPAQTVFNTESPVQNKSTEPVSGPPTDVRVPTDSPSQTETKAKPEPKPTEPAKTESAVQTEVPTETQPKQTEAPSSGSGLININTASAALLETLPGIGEVISQRIVDYRNTHGPFKTVYELINVKGIGEKRLAAIVHLVTV